MQTERQDHMAKKKMTRAQAAAARRPDDWEPPQPNRKPTQKKQPAVEDMRPTGLKDSLKKTFSIGIPFIILFVVMAIAAPFIVIYVSQFLGIQ